MIEKNEMIFGVRAVIEAIQAGKEIDKVLVKKGYPKRLIERAFCCIKGNIHPCTTCTGRAYQPYYKEKPSGSSCLHLSYYLPAYGRHCTFPV